MNNQSRQNDLVSAGKYNKLKRKFSVLREVRTYPKHQFIGILANYQWMGRVKPEVGKSNSRKSVSTTYYFTNLQIPQTQTLVFCPEQIPGALNIRRGADSDNSSTDC